MLFLVAPSFQPRSDCKKTSHPPTHGRIYLRNSQRVGVSGAKVDFFQGRGNVAHLRSTVPLGRAALFCGYPAINRRAIFDCPSGTIPGIYLRKSPWVGGDGAKVDLQDCGNILSIRGNSFGNGIASASAFPSATWERGAITTKLRHVRPGYQAGRGMASLSLAKGQD